MREAGNSVFERRDKNIREFNTFLLEKLPEESREKLLENVVFTTLPKNRYIFQEGQPADYICLIQKGQVKLSHTDAEGRENIVMILSENDTIWESLFLYEGKFPYSAVTMTEVRLCRIYRENFLRLVEDPAAALHVITMLSHKLHDANQRNQILAAQDPTARIAGFLLYSRERSPEDILHYRLEDIASSISLRMETVSRKLSELQNLGLVERIGKGKVRILDSSGLQKLFQG